MTAAYRAASAQRLNACSLLSVNRISRVVCRWLGTEHPLEVRSVR